MPNLNFRLLYATLIPGFIYQFLSNEFIDQNIFTCFELEDVRNSILKLHNDRLKSIKKFLIIDKEAVDKQNKIKDIMNNLDDELAEIDNEYYHRYTPGELKYIFDEIVNNIDVIYDAFKRETGINLSLIIGFKFKDGLESNMIIEFLNIEETPSYLEDVFFLPMENYFVSDNIIARIYFNYNKEKINQYEHFFNEIFKIINLKQIKIDDL